MSSDLLVIQCRIGNDSLQCFYENTLPCDNPVWLNIQHQLEAIEGVCHVTATDQVLSIHLHKPCESAGQVYKLAPQIAQVFLDQQSLSPSGLTTVLLVKFADQRPWIHWSTSSYQTEAVPTK